MPLYQTTNENGNVIGIYNGQRPSVAATKAFTTMRRRVPGLTESMVHVKTEGRREITKYSVVYCLVKDTFLGEIWRPVATKRTINSTNINDIRIQISTDSSTTDAGPTASGPILPSAEAVFADRSSV